MWGGWVNVTEIMTCQMAYQQYCPADALCDYGCFTGQLTILGLVVGVVLLRMIIRDKYATCEKWNYLFRGGYLYPVEARFIPHTEHTWELSI